MNADDFTDDEIAFLKSAVKTRWSVRTLGYLLGASSGSDGQAYTDTFVLNLLRKLESHVPR